MSWTHEERLDAIESWETENYDEVASWFADLDDIFKELGQLPDPRPSPSRPMSSRQR